MKSGNKRAGRTKAVATQKCSKAVPVPSQFHRDLVTMIREILQTCEMPENWLLEDKQRIWFLKNTYYYAKKLSRTEEFVTLTLQIACDNMQRMQAVTTSVPRASKRSTASVKQNPASSSLEQKQ